MADFDISPGVQVAYESEGENKATQTTTTSAVHLQVNTNAVVAILASITVVLTVLSLAGTCIKLFAGYDSVYGTTPKFNLDTEGNIPTFFSAMLLLTSGVLFQVIAVCRRAVHDSFARHWSILSVIFVYLALDEATEIHGLAMRPLSSFEQYGSVFHFSWVVLGLALVLGCGLYFLRLFNTFSPLYKRRFFVAAFVYCSGLIGMEMIGGAYADTYGEANITYELLTTLEEVLEIAGMVLLIRALLLYMQQYTGPVMLSVKSGKTLK